MDQPVILSIDLHWQAPAIVKQLADQGYTPRQPHYSDLWEKWAAHVATLNGAGLLTDREAYLARNRLRRTIAAKVEKLP